MGKTRFAPHTLRFAEVPNVPCVYVAELSGGLLKVGVGMSARGRLMSLASEVKRTQGVELLRFQVIPKRTVKAAYEVETTLVAVMKRLGIPIPGRREFFTGIKFPVARAIALAL